MARKVSVVVVPNSDHHRVVNYIMRKYDQKEVQRAVIGGDREPLQFVLTFEGGTYNDHLYKENYVELPIAGDPTNKMYYHIDCLEGYKAVNAKAFKKYLDNKEDNIFFKDFK